MAHPALAKQPGATGPLAYRPEIDGLRAIAILPVVLHHANPALLPGGFAGVDVFFVISGYLITAIIAGEIAQGRFSLLRFYERRVRRIVPALAAMLTATALASWAILTPEDFAQFAKALVSASLFASNLMFARGTDYFDSAEGMQPLIHTWTLGVEEQFYLLFPLLLMALSRWRRPAILPVVAVLGLASFAAALMLTARWPVATFYLLPTRMWELALGAICALLPLQRLQPARYGSALAASGLGMIAAGFWLIGPDSPAPGPLFLLPTAGTAVVILFAQGTMVARDWLGWRPLVLIGLMSFGTYLWHQPVLFFMRYVWFGPLPPVGTAVGIAVSLALGAASYRWLEQPVRQRHLFARPALLVAACVAALMVPLAAGIAGYTNLLMPRSHAEAQRIAGLRPPLAAAKMIEPVPGPLPFVLYGDSHAAQYYTAATERFGAGALVSASGCLAAGGLTSWPPPDPAGEACRTLESRLTALVSRRKVRTIIWAQRWERQLYTADSSQSLGMTDGAGGPHLLRAMERFAASLPNDASIILIGNSPTAWAAGPMMENGWLRCRAWHNVTCPDSFPRAKAEGRKVNALLRAFAASHPRFTYIDAHDPLCSQSRCWLVQDGRLNYWDGSHMTTAAARKVMAIINPAQVQP